MKGRAEGHSLKFEAASTVSVMLFVLLFRTGDICAKPVGLSDARKAAQGWLRVDPTPRGTALGRKIKSTEVFTDDTDEPSYYVVYLEPSGFVIVPADDEVEPVIAFASKGVYEVSDESHLSILVRGDVPNRIAAARGLAANGGPSLSDEARQRLKLACGKARQKWAQLQAHTGVPDRFEGDEVTAFELISVSDPRVDPLVESRWGQRTVCGNACYNYYTPPYDPCDPDNYPCGCVATAIAQLIRYWQYPTGAIGVEGFTIWVNGSEQTAYTRGGDGAGGPYQWSLMDLTPDCGTSDARLQAIGALCFDAGITVHMSYYSDGSGANMGYVNDSLIDTFDYTSAFYGYDGSGISSVQRDKMINTNLDADHPVILGISSPTVEGHAIIADGYGYNGSTLYHHLNMGWNGSDDAWYNLPDIIHWDTVVVCVYNIYTSGSGEIISGRITDGTGAPVSDVLVAGETGGGQIFSDTTNARGIYALTKVPSDTSFTVRPDKAGFVFSERNVTTGRSRSSQSNSGNLWAVDFVGRNADFNNDCVVDACDLKILSGDWLETPQYVPVGTEPDANHLVVYYRFDETSGSTAYDASASAYNGAVQVVSTGAPKTDAWDSGGQDAGCINFDGNTKVVVSSASMAFAGVSSAVAVSLWVNGNAAVQPDPAWGMAFQAGKSGEDRVLLVHIPTPNNSGVMFESGGKNVQRLFWTDAAEADWEGRWNHYVFTLDTATGLAKIYCNGDKKAEKTGATTAAGGISSFMVGNGFVSSTNYEYFGKIDDFRVYDYALSDDEVLYVFSGGQMLVFDSPAELYEDDIIDSRDFALFASQWLEACP
ncbi:MAG TPA: C10 family peptidase [Sedimentisphaerales bacterium]|nr:C10 family peptidase [Sedimentisphaerales bacterium]